MSVINLHKLTTVGLILSVALVAASCLLPWVTWELSEYSVFVMFPFTGEEPLVSRVGRTATSVYVLPIVILNLLVGLIAHKRASSPFAFVAVVTFMAGLYMLVPVMDVATQFGGRDERLEIGWALATCASVAMFTTALVALREKYAKLKVSITF